MPDTAAFDEVQFPADISDGLAGGPAFSTVVIVSASGAEQRLAQWSAARRSWDASHSVKTPAQMSLLQDFFVARSGRLRGFRFKDWGDWQFGIADDGVTPAYEELVALDATHYQLVRRYVSGGQTIVRNITKPVAGTVRLFSTAIKFNLATNVEAWKKAVNAPDGTTLTTSVTGTYKFVSTGGNISADGDGTGMGGVGPVFPNVAHFGLGGIWSAVGVVPVINGNAAVFGVGTATATTAAPTGGGDFSLLVNDHDGAFADNTGALAVSISGSAQCEIFAGWALDTTTGIVTFDYTPSQPVYAMGEFDVPSRFDTDRMRYSLEEWGIRHWESIPIVEIR